MSYFRFELILLNVLIVVLSLFYINHNLELFIPKNNKEFRQLVFGGSGADSVNRSDHIAAGNLSLSLDKNYESNYNISDSNNECEELKTNSFRLIKDYLDLLNQKNITKNWGDLNKLRPLQKYLETSKPVSGHKSTPKLAFIIQNIRQLIRPKYDFSAHEIVPLTFFNASKNPPVEQNLTLVEFKSKIITDLNEVLSLVEHSDCSTKKPLTDFSNNYAKYELNESLFTVNLSSKLDNWIFLLRRFFGWN